MCVAYPMNVKSIEGERAVVCLGTTEQEVSVQLLDDVTVGDYVIVHAGFAIQKLSVEEAQATIKIFEEIAGTTDGEAEQP